MNIEEISNTLPNGFHDAYIQRLNIDYAKQEAVFELEICVGDSNSENPVKRDEYRSGRLKLNGFLFCVIEPPDIPFDESSINKHGALWIADDSSDFGELKSYPLLPELSDGFRHWFFINNFNCFIYVAAMNAMFEWE
jgi:hypothetical protein